MNSFSVLKAAAALFGLHVEQRADCLCYTENLGLSALRCPTYSTFRINDNIRSSVGVCTHDVCPSNLTPLRPLDPVCACNYTQMISYN